MKKLIIATIIMASAFSAYAQQEQPTKNAWGAKLKESNFHLGLSLQTKYVWRGMEMIPNDSEPVISPCISYDNKGFYAYIMGATAINGKYSEVDLGLSYTYKWITIGVNDYYYPTVDSKFDQYFNFRRNMTGHWFEGVITVAPEKIPAFITVSNFFAGADKTPEGRQAYSTYAEIGTWYDFLDSHCLALTVGAALNRSCYNAFMQAFSVCNVELKYTYNVPLKKVDLPLSVAYIINPVFKKTFVNFTASLTL